MTSSSLTKLCLLETSLLTSMSCPGSSVCRKSRSWLRSYRSVHGDLHSDRQWKYFTKSSQAFILYPEMMFEF